MTSNSASKRLRVRLDANDSARVKLIAVAYDAEPHAVVSAAVKLLLAEAGLPFEPNHEGWANPVV